MALEEGPLSPTITKPKFPTIKESKFGPDPELPANEPAQDFTLPSYDKFTPIKLPVEPQGDPGQFFGGTLPYTALGLGFIGWNNVFDITKANEALAATKGLQAFYSVPTQGSITGWGGPLGEALTRAGGPTGVNVAYLSEAEVAAGRALAIAEETKRGHSVIQEAYNYVKVSAGRFQPLASHTLKEIGAGLSMAGDALFQFSLIPLNYMIKQSPWLQDYQIGGGPPTA